MPSPSLAGKIGDFIGWCRLQSTVDAGLTMNKAREDILYMQRGHTINVHSLSSIRGIAALYELNLRLGEN